MAKSMIRSSEKQKERSGFPYEMTELVWEGEKELQESLRRDVKKMELEIKRLNEKLTSRKLLKNHCEKIFC